MVLFHSKIWKRGGPKMIYFTFIFKIWLNDLASEISDIFIIPWRDRCDFEREEFSSLRGIHSILRTTSKDLKFKRLYFPIPQELSNSASKCPRICHGHEVKIWNVKPLEIIFEILKNNYIQCTFYISEDEHDCIGLKIKFNENQFSIT